MNDPRLERYLGSLESALRAFPVGDRAEIITEIRSHVLSALERDPSARLDSVLAALGEPEIVANRYLLERGLKPTKPPIAPIVKWLVIGFLMTVAMGLLFVAFIISRFSSIVEVHGSNVKALNGLIDVDGRKNRVTIRGISAGDDFGGSVNVDGAVSLIFDEGSVEVTTAESSELNWSCRGSGASPNPKVAGGVTTMDFSSVRDLHCEIGVPPKHALTVKGEKGKIEFDEPRFDVSASLDAGKIEFNDASDTGYKFTTAVRAGKVDDDFKSSDKPDAFKIDLRVDRGVISH